MTKDELVIDWQLSIALANNRPELAQEMLNMFIAELPEVKSNIKANQNNYAVLVKHIHRLAGAACYCGVPKLKELATSIETAIKRQNYQVIDELLSDIELSINKVIAAYEAGDYRD